MSNLKTDYLDEKKKNWNSEGQLNGYLKPIFPEANTSGFYILLSYNTLRVNLKEIVYNYNNVN